MVSDVKCPNCGFKRDQEFAFCEACKILSPITVPKPATVPKPTRRSVLGHVLSGIFGGIFSGIFKSITDAFVGWFKPPRVVLLAAKLQCRATLEATLIVTRAATLKVPFGTPLP